MSNAGCEVIVDHFRFTRKEIVSIHCGFMTVARWESPSGFDVVDVCDDHDDYLREHAPETYRREALPEEGRSTAYRADISRIERGKVSCTAKTLAKLSRALDVSMDHLAGG